MKRFKAPASIERLAVSMESSQVDLDGLTVRGVASVFGSLVQAWVPSILEPGSFKKSLAEKKLAETPFLWQHDPSEVLGLPTRLEETALGLEFEARIIPTQANRDRAMIMREGGVRGVSIGFDPVSSWLEEKDGEVIRHLTEVRLWEFSAVTFSGDPQARIWEMHAATPYQDLPLAAPDTPWDAEAAEARIRAWAEAPDAPTEAYRRAFLWVDSQAPQRFESHRLPIADVLDGELVVVPQALAIARGCLPAFAPADRARLAEQVTRYETKASHAVDEACQQLVRLSGRLPQLTHAGQGLSSTNQQRLQACLEALHALMMAAEPPTSSAEDQALTAARVDQLREAELLYADYLAR